jgi:hypothetical protein
MSDEQDRWTRRRFNKVGMVGILEVEKIMLVDDHRDRRGLYLWEDGEIALLRHREGRQIARTDGMLGLDPYRGTTNGGKPPRTANNGKKERI